MSLIGIQFSMSAAVLSMWYQQFDDNFYHVSAESKKKAKPENFQDERMMFTRNLSTRDEPRRK